MATENEGGAAVDAGKDAGEGKVTGSWTKQTSWRG
jgi:hypothetical protein